MFCAGLACCGEIARAPLAVRPRVVLRTAVVLRSTLFIAHWTRLPASRCQPSMWQEERHMPIGLTIDFWERAALADGEGPS